MDSIKTATTNSTLGPPESWTKERDGECTPLPITRTDDGRGNHIMQSTWVPDRDELDALNAGAPVILTIWGAMHPPVAVSVGIPAAKNG